ncbi:hypothetical protein PR003_g480 [Phytophthora rubi]|uniref:Secreted protein n=1 Tax=Phytophthora rubi TaxID=129364 RepID=A0A6A3MY35_9STRA|nr:hypothetical protein PR001_g8720 [Phytophthora rubi]KAE9048891.1 hypothetical protein PR002_g213 [Phytophthora rubi]KAE9359992.1 hypothetical protein PR003_g480 [Phytophthora rubi]
MRCLWKKCFFTCSCSLCSGDFSVLPSKITCEPFACAVQCGAVLVCGRSVCSGCALW